MADGIIRDPKMNPRERDYGIIYSVEDQKHYFYSKNDDWTRFCLPGEVVKFEKISDQDYVNEINYNQEAIDYEGIPIYGEVTLAEYNDDSNISPVYRRLIRPVPEILRRHAIRNAMLRPRPGEDRMKSDFVDPPDL